MIASVVNMRRDAWEETGMGETVREPRLWEPTVRHETAPDGTIYVWQDEPLGDLPPSINHRFMDWAARIPDQVWMAERGPDGAWQKTTWGVAADAIQRIGAALLDAGLSTERPLLILSGNSVAHALMALGAQHVGVPSSALAPAYALASGDHGKLKDVVAQLTPGMVFADDGDAFAPAIAATLAPDVPAVTVTGTVPDRTTIAYTDLLTHDITDAARAAHDAVDHDTVAKFLFTSGTTGSPKAVIQTQRMLTSNQEMVRKCYAFMQDTPPVVVDWAPWNHTASGNKVFNLVIWNGGTFYIDAGKPSPKLIGETIRNLREISPTWYFNVPVGYQMLLDAMETDEELRRTFFARVSMLMYAGAGMSQPVWDRVTRAAEDAVPGGVLLCTGFGATETGPFSLMCTDRQETSGNLGIPSHGVTLKLAPEGGKYEARIKSPSVTPGYWRAPKLTEEAFDDEGFYKTGDAIKLADPDDPSKGTYFDGRLAENFKLSSGTWVAVGPLRAKLTNDLKGLASDVVVAGEGRDDLAALVLPDWASLKKIAGDPSAEGADLLADPEVRAATADRLAGHAARATGSSTRVTRVMYLADPLEFDRGEVTDKGSINQRAVIRNRGDLVEALWSDDPRVVHPAKADA